MCYSGGRNRRGWLPVAEVRSRLTGRRLVALPFSDACGPLATRDARDASLAALADALDTKRRDRGIDLEVRGRVDGISETYAGRQYLQHLLPLSRDVAAVGAGFSKSHVRSIKRAERLGVAVELRKDTRALENFFAMHVRTRRRQGVDAAEAVHQPFR